jgi:hypothetical protein
VRAPAVLIPSEQTGCVHSPYLAADAKSLVMQEKAMPVARIFDWLFIDQLFHKSERGETIFAPYGQAAGAYLVPPEREASVRAGVRRLALFAPIGAMMLAVLLPRLIEWWWVIVLPTCWVAGGTLLALPVAFGAVIYALSRLTAGLAPAPGQ